VILVVDSVVKNGEIKEVGDKRFIRMANQFVNIDDLHIDLIDRINPFQKAFEILSITLSVYHKMSDTKTKCKSMLEITKEMARLKKNK
jgi:hypothetical protein